MNGIGDHIAGMLPDGIAGHRRSGAVAVADIVGYSTLMSTEGEATHARWMSLMHAILRPLAARHGSTLMKSTGDGVVAQFPTVVSAFSWAQAVQHGLIEGDVPSQPPITLRIALD